MSSEHRESKTLDPPLAERCPLSILVVDDDEICRGVTEGLLKCLGYQPRLAGSGKEALKLIDVESFDLVLMDIRMPSLDGYVTTDTMKLVLKNKKSTGPETKIVAITSLSKIDRSPHFHHDAFCGCLKKPIELDKLAELLLKVFEKKL